VSCTYPLTINTRLHGIMKVPCGRCIGCRLDKSKDWSLRCINEAQCHKENSFITLTYNNENLPKYGSVSKKELSKFIKRLRKEVDPIKIRYYGCGEYGKKLMRPHYHCLIFGYDFPDKEFHHVSYSSEGRFTENTHSNKVYISKQLDKVWKKGFSTIGDVTIQSAGYVSRYIRKKIGGEMALDHYKGKEPEFSLMSRRPGIGSDWYDRYSSDLYPKDFVTHKGKKYKPPRYYDNKLMREDWDLHEKIKERRKEKVKNPDIIRRIQKEKYLKNVTKTLNRRLENE